MSENKQDKPRICEILGVEVGEHFKVGAEKQEYYINEYGEMCFCGFEIWNLKCSEVLCEAINHPDLIGRKPRFSEDEIAFMRVLYGVVPDAVITRCGRESLFWDVPGGGMDAINVNRLPYKAFPTLRPGDSVVLRDVVGGAE